MGNVGELKGIFEDFPDFKIASILIFLVFLLLFQVSELYRKVQGIGGLHFHKVACKSVSQRAKTSPNNT